IVWQSMSCNESIIENLFKSKTICWFQKLFIRRITDEKIAIRLAFLWFCVWNFVYQMSALFHSLSPNYHSLRFRAIRCRGAQTDRRVWQKWFVSDVCVGCELCDQ